MARCPKHGSAPLLVSVFIRFSQALILHQPIYSLRKESAGFQVDKCNTIVASYHDHGNETHATFPNKPQSKDVKFMLAYMTPLHASNSAAYVTHSL